MSQGVVSSPENLPGNKAYSDLLLWPHTVVSIYISSQSLITVQCYSIQKQKNKHQKNCSGSDLSRNEFSGVFHNNTWYFSRDQGWVSPLRHCDTRKLDFLSLAALLRGLHLLVPLRKPCSWAEPEFSKLSSTDRWRRNAVSIVES